MRVNFGAWGLLGIIAMIIAGLAFNSHDLIFFAVIIMAIVGLLNLEIGKGDKNG